MASGSIVSGKQNTGYYVQIDWTSTVDRQYDRSYVTAKIYFCSIGSGWDVSSSATKYGNITINGSVKNFSTAGATLASGQKKYLAEYSIYVGHDSAGDKTITISGDYNPNISSGITLNNFALSGSANLGDASPAVGTCTTIAYPHIDKVSSRTMTISWNAVTGYVTGYLLRVYQNGAWSSDINVGNVTSKSYTLTSTTTNYAYSIRPYYDAGTYNFYGGYKTGVTFDIDARALPAPTIAVSDTSVNRGDVFTVSWGAVANAVGYTLHQTVDGGVTWTILVTQTTALSRTITATNDKMQFRIRTDGSGNYSDSGYTNSAIVTVADPPMTAPASVALSDTSPTYGQSNTLTWSAVTNASTYTVEKSVDSGTTWSSVNTAVSGTSLAVSGFAVGTVMYRVKANANTNYAASPVRNSANYTVSRATLGTPTLTVSPTSIIRGASINQSWSTDTLASSYNLQVSNDNGISWSTLYSGTASSFAYVPTSSDTIQFRVKKVSGNSNYNDSDFSSVSTASVNNPTLGTPTGLTVSDTTPVYNTNITVSWTAVANATGYSLQKSLDGGTTWASTYTTTATSYTTTATGDQVKFRVKATAGSYDDSAYATSITYLVSNAVLAVPSSITYPTVIIKGQTINIAWDAVSNSSGYNLQFKEGTSGVWTSITLTATTALSASYTCDTIGPIQFQVRALGTGNYDSSAYKVGTVVQVDYPTLAASTSISVSDTTPTYKTNVTVSWASVVNATSYVLEKSYDGGQTYPYVFNTSALNYTTDASSGQIRFRVKAKASGYYDSAYLTTANMTVNNATLPSPESITYTTSITRGNPVAITWLAVANATAYTVEVSQNGGAWAVIAASTTALTVSNTVNFDGTVQYRVKAIGGGYYNDSTYTTGTKVTIGFPPLATPSTLDYVTGVVRGKNVTLSWSSVTNATSYILEYSKNGGTFAQIYSGPALSLSYLVDGTTYRFRVKAQADNYTESAYKTGIQMDTSYPTIVAPGSLAVTPATGIQAGDTVSVNWTIPASDVGAVSTILNYVLEVSWDNFATAGTQIYSGGALNTTYAVPKDRTKTNLYFRVKASADTYNTSAWRTTSGYPVKQNTPPTLAVTNAATNVIIKASENFTISGTVTDPDTDTLTITGTVGGIVKTTTVAGPASAKAWTLTWTGAELAESTYTTSFTVTVDDGNGGTATAYYTGDLTLDKSLPVITVSGVSTSATYTDTVTVTFSATDSLSGLASCTATLDGANYVSGTAITTGGSHTLVVTAIDKADNTATATRTFSVNKTPTFTTVGIEGNDPTAGFVTLTNNGTYLVTNTARSDLKFKVNAHDSDAADTLQYQVLLRGTLYTDWTALTEDTDVFVALPFTSLLLGDNLVKLNVKDNKGATASFSVTLRNRVPASLSLSTADAVIEKFLGVTLDHKDLTDIKPTGYTAKAMSLQDYLDTLS
jgi:hypothetical protein